MSGGVDSSVSAALLVEQGYAVTGIMLRLWSESGSMDSRRDNRCCTRDQMLDAHFVARKLGIPFEVVDISELFKEQIVDAFIRDYSNGLTPNPCLHCNRHIRFGFLLDLALKRGARFLATGHYARITRSPEGMFELRQGADRSKDQSYVLSRLNQEKLRHVLFPVGTYTKQEVRKAAARFRLPVAAKHESQDLCFIADGDYRRFLHEHVPGSFDPGPIRLFSGGVVGEHTGLPAYTIGQRKGLHIAWPEPLYVVEKDVRSNTLVVAPRGQRGKQQILVHDMNWIDGYAPDGPFSALVKVRYKSTPAPAEVRPLPDGSAEVVLENPLSDIAPGQGAVFYEGDRVIGSGIIKA
jgi:tRNA-specific 2-thiouridylase